jgi:hypothetical protein
VRPVEHLRAWLVGQRRRPLRMYVGWALTGAWYVVAMWWLDAHPGSALHTAAAALGVALIGLSVLSWFGRGPTPDETPRGSDAGITGDPPYASRR